MSKQQRRRKSKGSGGPQNIEEKEDGVVDANKLIRFAL